MNQKQSVFFQSFFRQLSGSLPRAPEQRDNVASDSETGPLIGLSGAVGRQRSGSLPRAPEQRDNVASEAETGALIGLSGAVGRQRSGSLPRAPECFICVF